MDPNDWTPARGWMIALGKAGYRTAAGAGVASVVMYFAWPIGEFFPLHWAILAVLFLITAAVGYPIGYTVGRKLVEDCGLSEGTILLPVIIILAGGEIAVFQIVGAIRGQWGPILVVVACGIIIWSLIACVKTILFE